MRLRDEFGAPYEDANFAALVSARDQPALRAWRLAVVTAFQRLEDPSDRHAADAVRARIDWNYPLDREMTDASLAYSGRSEFCCRLVAGASKPLLLDRVLERLATRGLVRSRRPSDARGTSGASRKAG